MQIETNGRNEAKNKIHTYKYMSVLYKFILKSLSLISFTA